MTADFATNREKLDAIQTVVGRIFTRGFDDREALYADLMLIDSTCDVPLFAAKDEEVAWND